jgi:hypothetical protein
MIDSFYEEIDFIGYYEIDWSSLVSDENDE